MRNRREILAAAAVGIATPSLLRRAWAQQDAIEIGSLVSLSGTFANIGEQVDIGSKIAIDHYKTAAGRPLRYVQLDDQGDPGRAVRLTQDAIRDRGIRFFMNCTNSAIALAVAKEVASSGGVYINQAGADEMTGTLCNKNTFRWPVATYSAVNTTVRPFMKQFPDAKKWYTITGQYVFGDSLLKNLKDVLGELGGQHVGNSYHSLSDREYSGFITAAIAAQPDVLCICNFGSQTTDVLRQAVSFGMKRNTKIVVVWSTGLDQFQSLGPDICEGVYFGANYWHGVDAPGNRLLTGVIKDKLKVTPSYLLTAGWACTQATVEALNKAGSAEVPAVIKAFETLSYEGPTGLEKVRAEDHQVLKDYYLLLGKPKAKMLDKDDYVDVISAQKAFLPPDKTGCKL
ncbi:ABC transporter substrate-binding protein [Bradyrhizobium yuanmingense]|uniref:ABC transporter substrate-binding protein n=1 Tax=Bradyrhizobium yuanmingense TaxID=108015 RepID=UPI0023BA0601|nr:ABC transporter substrate-binding protein [Bradyrhizobium yuanmingense]MDF0520135.1 ABC transporter substrate-binding protein [Bradyrhizobium yuanmingense]